MENKKSYDKTLLETVEKLIEVYKREFGDDWAKFYAQTIRVQPSRS